MSSTKTVSRRFSVRATLLSQKSRTQPSLSQSSNHNSFNPNTPVQKPTSSFNPNTPVQKPTSSFNPNTPVQKPTSSFNPNAPVQKPTSSFNPNAPVQKPTSSFNPSNHTQTISHHVSSSITSISPLHSQIANSLTNKQYSLPIAKLRIDIAHNDNFLHFSRVPSEDEAKLVLELFSSKEKSALLKYFSTPIAILRSKRENLYSPTERAYLISAIGKNHSPLKKTRFSKFRIKIAGKLVSILATAHSLGILIGDTTADNIVVKNNIQPIFRSAGHMRAMSAMGEGISEFLLLLCNLMHVGAIFTQELIHLIRHYLASNKEAYLHAKYFLHGQKEKNTSKIDEALKAHLLLYYSKYFA